MIFATDSNFFSIQMSNHAVQNADGYCKNNTFDNADAHFFVLLVCSYFDTFFSNSDLHIKSFSSFYHNFY